ncbi:hypothetical protein [Burkholderia ubonensis]|uniref:hypothetical protein n=1 Tax=Burkholderia ubonensis TaxID=101571 RepID=UPI000A8F749B|nr:hypothetical protein [Burkholderia ubonensis]
MSDYAVIQNGIVVNTVEWDGVSAWTPPMGSQIQPIPTGAYVGVGSSFDGQNFSSPPNLIPQFV